ncbi:MAG: hypothetical protein WBD73_06160 [Candidatus Acidiferrales bacterium]
MASGYSVKVDHRGCEGHHGLAKALCSVDCLVRPVISVFGFRISEQAFRIERVDDNARVQGVTQDRVNLILQRASQKARGSHDEDTLAGPVRQEIPGRAVSL